MVAVQSVLPLLQAEALMVVLMVVRDGMPPGMPACDQSIAREGSRMPLQGVAADAGMDDKTKNAALERIKTFLITLALTKRLAYVLLITS